MSLKYNEQEIKAIYHGDDEIVKRIINDNIVYEKNKVRKNAFRFTCKSVEPGAVLYMRRLGNAPKITLEMSKDGINYEPCDIYDRVEFNYDETIYFRGNNETFSISSNDYNSFVMSDHFKCYGSIMDLCDGGTDSTVCTADYQFAKLFANDDVYGVPQLMRAPDLPATTLTKGCYYNMFYNERFTDAPELPATTLAPYCYDSMFYNCYTVKHVKVGATSWNRNDASFWLYGVSPTGTFYKPKELTNIPLNSVSGIPKEWKVVDI